MPATSPCPACGRVPEPDSRYCAACGSPLTPVTGAPPTVGLRVPLVLDDVAAPRRRSSAPVLVSAAAAVLLLGGGGIALLTLSGGDGPAPRRAAAPPAAATTSAPARTPTPTPSPSATPTPTPEPDALAQAAAYDALLTRTSDSKGAVGDAVARLQACTVPPAEALTVFEQAAADRRGLLAELDATPLTAVPEGAALRAGLAEALTASAEADDAFAAWARGQAAGCVPDPGNADLRRGVDLSATRARPAKERVVAAWAPVAARYGLPARTADQL